MSEEEDMALEPARFSKLKWILAILGIAALLFVFAAMTTLVFVFELPFRFFFGWILHLIAVVPGLSPPWGQLVGISACLAVVVILTHRFIGWWLAANERETAWRLPQTLAVISLLLLGSVAAIAISGIVHQLVWLADDEFIVNSGKDVKRTVIMNHTRMLMLAMEEFREAEGRPPDSLRELEEKLGPRCPETSISPGAGRAKEPFLLVRPGAPPIREDVPVLISPPIRNQLRMIIGFESGFCRIIYEREFQEWFEKYRAMSAQDPASYE
jgi:hypothetical protein